MPIPQDRVVRVLEAAEEYSRQYRLLWAKINEAHVRAAAHEITYEQALNTIVVAAQWPERLHYINQNIHEERARFNLTYRKNATERERLRAKRAGIPFRTWMLHQETMLQPGEPAPPGTDYAERKMALASKKAGDIVEQLTEREALENILPPHDSLGLDDSDINFDNFDEDEIKHKASEAKAEAFTRLHSTGDCKAGDILTCHWPTCNCGE